MTPLAKRLMWPRLGEEVVISQHGKVMVDGHVIYSGNDSMTLLGKDGVTTVVANQVLSAGLDDGSIVVKKKTGPLNTVKR